MASGRARLRTDGRPEPLELESGDIAILTHRAWVELTGGASDGDLRQIPAPQRARPTRLFDAVTANTDIVLDARVDLNPVGEDLLVQALPPVGHVRAAAAASTNLRCSLDRLLEEATSGRIGSAFAIRQYGQLLLLNVLRAYIEQTDLPPGWLRLLTDERLRPSLDLMHANPGERWSLERLARASVMSRTSFATYFRSVAGVPPLAYLSRWRMLIACRALRDSDVQVGTLAFDLGYGSESAFSTAFKREIGLSPLKYRFQEREQPLLVPHAVTS